MDALAADPPRKDFTARVAQSPASNPAGLRAAVCARWSGCEWQRAADPVATAQQGGNLV
jgi:hypothetical protein